MTISHTVSECEAEITAIDAKVKELRGLPTSGTIGRTSLDHSRTLGELRRERGFWLRRLAVARNAGRVPVSRRIY